jgi:uncharacterized protein YndB with AHSA1/START domain
MNVDIPATVGKNTRKLSRTERSGREAWCLTLTRIYETGIEDAWDAITNPERLPHSFLPISGDLKIGGRYQFQGNAGGVIERCEPPRLVAVTWEMHGDVSWVTVSLDEQGEKTRLTLEHVAHVPEAIFDQYGPGGVGVGWDLALMGLGLHFETRAPVDSKVAEAWVTGAEGRPFVEGCSNAWAEASIAAGTDAKKARDAAAQVSDFYSPRAAQT